MNVTFWITLYLTGLLGGLHCVGMCGGILGALAVSGESGAPHRRLAIHVGRITSYSALGAGAGTLGSAIDLFHDLVPLQVFLYVAANVVLLAVGAYLLGWTKPMARVEAAGARLWRHVAPLTRKWIPVRTPGAAFAVGSLWGFMPCGLVYGALAMALVSGGVCKGAAVMAVFGLGTLPNLLAAGAVLRKGLSTSVRRAWRWVSGTLVLGFGLHGLAHAAGIQEHLRRGLYCLSIG